MAESPTPNPDEYLTTAGALLAYAKELEDGRFSPELVASLVLDAAHIVVSQEGLGVKK